MQILKSPSVLFPVFEYVKKEKGINQLGTTNFRFNNWNNSLEVKTIPGTTVLNISYKDQDKQIILPVLNLVSSVYQEYSNRSRLKSINSMMNFLQDQLVLYKQKSNLSLKKSKEFAIEHDLIPFDLSSSIGINKNYKINSNINSSNSNLITTNVEFQRIEATNRIKEIDEVLLSINTLENDPNQIIYKASTFKDFQARANIPTQIKQLDLGIARLKTVYKVNDTVIKNALKERVFLVNLLRSEFNDFLYAERSEAESRLKAAKRPNGIINTYKQLVRDSEKDFATNVSLENQINDLSLEKAKYNEPWELITKPHVFPNHIFPKAQQAFLFGSIIGTFLGTFIALVYERITNKIYSKEELEQLSNLKIVEFLDSKNELNFLNSLDLLKSGILADIQDSVSILIVGNIQESKLKQLRDLFSNSKYFNLFNLTYDLNLAISSSNILLLTSLGLVDKTNFIDINKKLKLQKSRVLGLLLI